MPPSRVNSLIHGAVARDDAERSGVHCALGRQETQGCVDVAGHLIHDFLPLCCKVRILSGPASAKATEVDATFWIETIAGTGGHPDILQLQYTQLVQLDFNGIRWPHVTVGTLRKT